MPAAVTHLLGPDQGESVQLLALGVRFLVDGGQTGGAFSLGEHPLPPRALGSPLHTHHREDEYSFVLEGRFGVQLGDEVLELGPGDLLVKPRGVAHAFWNAGDEPARLLELISPAGFEHYFRDLAPSWPRPSGTRPPSTRWSPATSSTSTSPPSRPWPSGTTCGWDSRFTSHVGWSRWIPLDNPPRIRLIQAAAHADGRLVLLAIE
jgi:mannose-6-phosphate isomerase-like protein (cupin superfamily)